jgi:hypothetical protein
MYGRLCSHVIYSEALGELEIAAELNPILLLFIAVSATRSLTSRIGEAIPYFHGQSTRSHDPLRWAFIIQGARTFVARVRTGGRMGAQGLAFSAHYWGFSHRVAALGHLQRSDELVDALTELRQINSGFAKSTPFL